MEYTIYLIENVPQDVPELKMMFDVVRVEEYNSSRQKISYEAVRATNNGYRNCTVDGKLVEAGATVYLGKVIDWAEKTVTAVGPRGQEVTITFTKSQ